MKILNSQMTVPSEVLFCFLTCKLYLFIDPSHIYFQTIGLFSTTIYANCLPDSLKVIDSLAYRIGFDFLLCALLEKIRDSLISDQSFRNDKPCFLRATIFLIMNKFWKPAYVTQSSVSQQISDFYWISQQIPWFNYWNNLQSIFIKYILLFGMLTSSESGAAQSLKTTTHTIRILLETREAITITEIKNV